MNPETYLPPEESPFHIGLDLPEVDPNALPPITTFDHLHLPGNLKLNEHKLSHNAPDTNPFLTINSKHVPSKLENPFFNASFSNNEIVKGKEVPQLSLKALSDDELHEKISKLMGNTDFWDPPAPNLNTVIPGLSEAPLGAKAKDGDWSGWFAHDPELGETRVHSSAETAATPEKTSKAHKLGKVVMQAVSVISGASILAPGTSLHYAKQQPEQSHEESPDVEHATDLLDIVEDDDWFQPVYVPELAAKPEPVETVETHEQWTGAFEQKGYIKEAPRFKEQVQDTTRTNRFRYYVTMSRYVEPEKRDGAQGMEMTEHEGLVALEQFLEDYVEKISTTQVSEKLITDAAKEIYKNKAQGMLDDLTFIGSKEYAEAAKGIGDYWKAYLDEDPARQLCVQTRISRSSSKRKSDVYLNERILETFTEEELERYSGRIVTEFEDITAEPKNLKVVLLDDWTISGEQMKDAYSSLHGSVGITYNASLEVNLLAASPARIESGIDTRVNGLKGPTLPVRAYYRAHAAAAASAEYGHAHISGTHSSVDYEFENDIDHMVNHLKKMASQEENNVAEVTMPPLTHIIRAYRYTEPSVVVTRSRISKRPPRPPVADTQPERGAALREEGEEEIE